MKYSFMLHFIWVFTVCKSTRLGVDRTKPKPEPELCYSFQKKNHFQMNGTEIEIVEKLNIYRCHAAEQMYQSVLLHAIFFIIVKT